MNAAGFRVVVRQWIGTGDAVIYLWLLAVQPLASLFAPHFSFSAIGDARHFLMGAVCLNFVNLFLLMVLVQERYIRTGVPAGFSEGRLPGPVQMILNPVILILINGCFTIMWMGFYTGYESGSVPLTLVIILILILVLVAGAVVTGRITNRFYDAHARAVRVMGWFRAALALPMIVVGAEACRQLAGAMKLRGADGINWGALAVLVLAEGPLLYAFCVFLLRATVLLEIPGGRWLFRYAMFIASIIANGLMQRP